MIDLGLLDFILSATCVSLAFHIVELTDKDAIGQVDEAWVSYLRKIVFLTLAVALILATGNESWEFKSIAPKAAGCLVLAVNVLAIKRRRTKATKKEDGR